MLMLMLMLMFMLMLTLFQRRVRDEQSVPYW